MPAVYAASDGEAADRFPAKLERVLSSEEIAKGREASPLVVLLGPTASGKTSLSLELAQRFSGEIVSCDSVAVYREMEIGTAKPSLEERARFPHHLIDVADVTEHFTAGEYSRQARQALTQITARQRLPIVTGGTGLYLRALIDGLFPAPESSEELRGRLRQKLKAKGSSWLHRILQRLDFDASHQIHPNDAPKIIRALEVCLTARQPMTKAWESGRDRLLTHQTLRIGLNPHRQELYARINRRAAAMFHDGLLEETRSLALKYGEGARPLLSLGYRQAMELLRGEATPAAAVASAQQGHRNYAKRQLTWFRREPAVHWLSGFGDDPSVRDQAIKIVDAAIRAR